MTHNFNFESISHKAIKPAIAFSLASLVSFAITMSLTAADLPSKEKSLTKSDQVVIQEAIALHVKQMFAEMSDAGREGYRVLTENAYLQPDFDSTVLDKLQEGNWKLPFGDAEPVGRREETLRAFGISMRHDAPSKPLQYVVKQAQGSADQVTNQSFVMNCFACHGGNTLGATFPGAPNTTFALESLTEQVRRIKLKNKIKLGHMDLGSMFMPLGSTVGSSNAVMFGVALMSFRDKDLNVLTNAPAEMTHHDMDAPPWWHFSRKSHMYIDGFADKGHKGLMQFMLVRQNGPEKFRAWAADFEKVYEFISQVKPPKYPLPIDPTLAAKGESVFSDKCASCHGTYRSAPEYPELNIPIDEIGTDRVRWESLTPAYRKHYGDSWFADYGNQATYDSPEGYTAPPLDGIWATAPYFHNGSIPTLWHVLHAKERPQVWKRSEQGLDTKRIGFNVEIASEVPKGLSGFDRRWYFDTRVIGKSAAGHLYPEDLSEEEKTALLEYLKTL
jgi:mono/diheme cytochrome c family protein